jgi:hypothetical protein
MINNIYINLIIPDKPKASGLAYCWNNKCLRSIKMINKRSTCNRWVTGSEMKHTWVLVETKRRARWIILALLRLPPEPWQFHARSDMIPLALLMPAPEPGRLGESMAMLWRTLWPNPSHLRACWELCTSRCVPRDLEYWLRRLLLCWRDVSWAR